MFEAIPSSVFDTWLLIRDGKCFGRIKDEATANEIARILNT